MNKTAIKNFAIWARVQLIEAVKQKAFEYEVGEEDNKIDLQVIGGRLLSDTEKEQRNELIRQIKRLGFYQVMEEAAYTWFNRFIALRYMEVKNYLPSKTRIFSDENNAFKPQVLKEAMTVEIDGLDRTYVLDLLDKQDNETLYKYLIITQCNALNALLPEMFEKISNWTELLFPNNLLSAGSVLDRLVTDIDVADWEEQVEIIGWLYQYYITEKHKEIIDIKTAKAIKKEDVPAATQLFTTDWVVKYIIDNSLGKYWIERNSNSPLKEKLKYYVQPSDFQPIDESVTPESITFYDPCMGSGHFLVYAFDVLMQIYIECGWGERDAAKSIVENNLYGIDIDKRAYQLAYFAVMMKARSYSRRILTQDVKCNLCAIEESNELNYEYLTLFGDLKATASAVADEMKDAKEYGSILIIKTPLEDLLKLQTAMEVIENTAYDNFFDSVKQSGIITDFKPLLKQAIMLARKYSIVDTNPPYMNKYDAALKKYILDNYADYKGDMFSVFIARNFQSTVDDGYMGYMTPLVWMFIQTYEKLRSYIINQKHFVSLIQFEYSAFEEATVPICSFILQNKAKNENGVFFRLSDFKGGMALQEAKTLAAIADHSCGYYFEADQANFKKIPGSPIAYWVDGTVFDLYSLKSLDEVAKPRHGLATSDNNRFLRLWFEVNFKSASLIERCDYSKKWFPMNKGGSYRKWYGNLEWIINYEQDGKELKDFAISIYKCSTRTIQNTQFYFKKCITWSALTSGAFSVRWSDIGTLFGSGGYCAFTEEDDELFIVALLNNKVSSLFLQLVSPTLNYEVGHIKTIPVKFPEQSIKNSINELVDTNISISKSDWDSFETSWDFKKHPLVSINNDLWDATGIGATMHYYYGENPPRPNSRLELCYLLWQGQCEERFNQLKANEEELNRIFIDIYGLQDELTPEVEDKDVTVRKADLQREIKSLISYAVGCMFGRYAPDAEGLQYAGGSWSEFLATCNSQLATEMIDSNNIIPITDDEYFDDDIVGYFVNFVRKVYGEETLEENLKFIADALGGSGTPREVIRKYFISDFYKDHLKIYQKRPIYWLFDSGKKNGFKALIYMHRYTPDLLARMRTDYIHEQQERYRTQIALTEQQLSTASASEKVKLNKKLAKLKGQALEVQVYEEKIHHLADMMIDIDLDDGVKVNYAKFGDLLAKIK